SRHLGRGRRRRLGQPGREPVPHHHRAGRARDVVLAQQGRAGPASGAGSGVRTPQAGRAEEPGGPGGGVRRAQAAVPGNAGGAVEGVALRTQGEGPALPSERGSFPFLAVSSGYASAPVLRRRVTTTAPAPRATATPPTRPITGSAELEPVAARLPVA